jgi:integrase
VEGTTKGGRSRVVGLDADTVEVMRDHRRRQAAERLAASRWSDDDGDLVFRAEDGAAMFPSTLSTLMRKLVAGTALPHARLHDLRHIHATTLLLAGVPGARGRRPPRPRRREHHAQGLRARPTRADRRRGRRLRASDRGRLTGRLPAADRTAC